MNTLFSKASALTALLATATVWAQTPQTQGSVGAAAQGSASAQTNSQTGVQAAAVGAAQGNAVASTPDGQTGAALESGSSVNAVLSKPLDSEHSKPGDPVSARTTQPAKTDDGTPIPSGSMLAGHVASVEGGAGGAAGSSIGLVFDRAILKGGHEVPLRHMTIRALAAAQSEGSAGVGDGRAMVGGSAGMAGGGRGGLVGGAGLVGRTGGAVGGTVGGAVGGAGSIGGAGMGALQAGPGARGGLDASGLLTSQSAGVFGLRGVSLAASDTASAAGSVVTSGGKRLRLDEGTRMLLTSSERDRGRETSDSKKPPAKSEPERR